MGCSTFNFCFLFLFLGKVREEEASQREIAFLRKAADEAKFCLGRYREEAGAERSRWSSEVERVEREADGLRRQLDNAVWHEKSPCNVLPLSLIKYRDHGGGDGGGDDDESMYPICVIRVGLCPLLVIAFHTR